MTEPYTDRFHSMNQFMLNYPGDKLPAIAGSSPGFRSTNYLHTNHPPKEMIEETPDEQCLLSSLKGDKLDITDAKYGGIKKQGITLTFRCFDHLHGYQKASFNRMIGNTKSSTMSQIG